MFQDAVMQPAQAELAKIFREKESLEAASRLHWLHWLVVTGSLLITFGAWFLTSQQIEEKAKAQFEARSEHVVDLVAERMQKYEDALWSGVAMIHAEGGGTEHPRWLTFSADLKLEEKYPGINGIGVIHYLRSASSLEKFIAEQRSFQPDFKVHPTHDKKEFLPITFIEPIQDNRPALGLDMAHEANRYTAALKARDTGLAQITGPITLVQDAEKTPGFLFYAPFYKGGPPDTFEARRQKFAGLVYAPFVMKRLMAGTLHQERRQVGIRIDDGREVLYDEHDPANNDFDPDPLLRKSESIEIYGRIWHFDIRSKNSFRDAVHSNQPLVILFGGIFIDALLLTLFVLLTRSNRRAVRFSSHLAKNYEAKLRELETTLHDLADNEARTKAIIDNTIDGLITISDRGIVESFNSAAEDVFGYAAGEVIGQNVKILMPEPYHSEHDGYLKTYERTNKPSVIGAGREVEGRRKDGSVFPLNLAVAEVHLGRGEKLYSGTVRDISDQKRAEKHKEDLIAGLSASNAELEQFAYVASHDLQEPLRKVQAFGDRLVKTHGDKLDEQGCDYLQRMQSATGRMQQLIDDLLSFSRIGKQDEAFTAVSLNGVLDSTQQILETSIEESGATVTVGDLPNVIADQGQMERLFQNLLGNALKYRRDSVAPEICVSVVSSEQGGGFCVVAVKDNGIGFEEQHVERIFGVFQRLHGRSEYEGTGIGLAICKKIAERHGGWIKAEKNPEFGATFYVALPTSVKTTG